MSNGWEGFGALRYLYVLRMRARGRRLLKSLKQPKRLLLMVFIIAVLALVIAGKSLGNDDGGNLFAGANRERIVALFFSFSFVATMISAVSNGVLAFTPAEMQFLFPAPIGTRALLAGHLLAAMVKSFTASLIFSTFLTPAGTPYPQAVVSYLVLLFSLTLLGMAVDLGMLRVPRSRRKVAGKLVGLAALATAAGAVGLQVYRAGGKFEPRMLDVIGWPVSPWTALFLARSTDVFLSSLSMCLGLSALLAIRPLTFRGDVRESATHSSERIQKQLQRMAKGNVGQDRPQLSAGRTLPMLPRWGGAGVHAWRQLSSLSRRRKSYMLLLVFSVFCGLGAGISTVKETPEIMAGMMIGMLCFAGPLYVQCDFRSDFDCLAYLRSLPSSPMALAAGQIMASVLVIYGFQLLLGSWVFAVIEPSQYLLWIFIFLTLPLLNAVQLCVENGTFLLYPYRIDYTRGPPGATQVARMYALLLAKMILLMLSLLVVGVPAWLLAFKAGMPLLAALVIWVLLAFEVVMLVWLVGRIFLRVDPSRDLTD